MDFLGHQLDYTFIAHGLLPRPGWEFPAAAAVPWFRLHPDKWILGRKPSRVSLCVAENETWQS